MRKAEFLELIRRGVEESSEIDLDKLNSAKLRYIILSKIDDEFEPQTENAVMFVKLDDGCIAIDGYAPAPYLNIYGVDIDCIEDVAIETTEEEFIKLLQKQFDKVVEKVKEL